MSDSSGADIPVALIVAAADNDVIGRDNQLPWHLPADLRHFKAVTMGKPIIMGRKTYISIGRPLPGRSNIVLTRDAQFSAAGVQVVHTLVDALALARRIAAASGADEVMVIGGAEVYREALPLAARIYLTRVHLQAIGDAHFLLPAAAGWQEQSREFCPAAADLPACSFTVWERPGRAV